MGIKRCPSFSKRPGFPCGLRVLLLDPNEVQRTEAEQLLKECSYEVTQCSTAAEALSRLSSSCSYDVLLADQPSLSSSGDLDALVKAAEGLPLVLMAASPSPDDVLSGVKLGAADFLSKPLALLKLRNLWQHTVRKMMCNMNINCSDSAAAVAVDELEAQAACLGKPRVSMEVIHEESDEDLAAGAAAAAAAGAAAAGGKPPAPASPSSANTPGSSNSGSVINYSNGPNMALAITSSFYESSKRSSSLSLSRCGSSAMTGFDAAANTSGSGPDSPVMDRPTKQQHSHHGPVRSCPSTRSLSSVASCHSSWTMGLPASPSSEGLNKVADAAGAADTDSMCEDAAPAGKAAAPRCMKKAVRHPPAAASPAPAATAAAGAKPPLAGKPAAAAQQKPATGSPAASAGRSSFPAGLASVPLPTGLGALPQGMVWGLPMVPLVRAPGLLPSATPSASSSCAGQAVGMPPMPMAPWGMCGMPMFGGMSSAAFMGGMVPPMGPMPFPAAPAAAAGYGMPAGAFMDSFGQQSAMQAYSQQAWRQAGEQGTSKAAAAAAPTGAAVAAALDASFSAAELLGSDGGDMAQAAAAAVGLEEDAFDFMLGDITAEDDLTDVCGGTLGAELSTLTGSPLKVPVDMCCEMQALEADLQQQQAAAAAAAARCSFESSAAQRQRVSFDCSTASTCTAARASFEASQRCGSNRVSFEVSTRNRVSFEVNCHNSSKAPAAPAVVAAAAAKAADRLKNAASAPAELLGSVTDLFTACSDDSSNGSGMQHVDSCSMLADLQSFFAASGDSSCPQDCADSAITGNSDMFMDPLEDMPIDMGMRKTDSFAELINASLPGLAN